MGHKQKFTLVSLSTHQFDAHGQPKNPPPRQVLILTRAPCVIGSRGATENGQVGLFVGGVSHENKFPYEQVRGLGPRSPLGGSA